jgi:PAS domain S-box-containing protein
MYAIPLKHNHELLGVVMLGLMQNSLDSLIVTRLLDSFHSHLASEIRRKQTELELNQLFEFAPDIVCIAGTDGYYKKVNPALTKVLGYTPAELLAHPVSHFIHPEDVGKTVQQIEELKKGNPTIYFENRYITKAGVIKWLAWTATPPSREGLVFSVGKDISDKKELELMLYKATNLANIGAWEINLITNQLNWSSMTRRIHDITDDSYTPSFNDAIQFYCEGHHRNHIIQKVTNAVSKGEKWDIESQIVTAQKQTKWIRSIGEPEFVDGKCIRIVGSFQDIDHIKQAEFLARML